MDNILEIVPYFITGCFLGWLLAYLMELKRRLNNKDEFIGKVLTQLKGKEGRE